MQITDNLFCFDSAVKMPIVELPARMCLLQTKTGLLLVSPLPDIEKFADQIKEIGSVTDIIAPNLFHHLGVKAAMKLYPDATLWGAPGFAEKIKDIAWQKTLTRDEWQHHEVELFAVEGMPKVNEVVLLHKESKTLICQDLCFHHTDGKGFGYWLVFKMFGTYRRFAVSKMLMKMTKDRGALSSSIEKIFAQDFDRVVMGHGKIVEIGGKAKLARAFQEHGFDKISE